MPIHDWTRVSAGTFHDFHCSWITEIKRALNRGVLPADYYAQAEQYTGRMSPDVITLHHESNPADAGARSGTATVERAPPKVRFTGELELDHYVLRRRTLVIRHSSGDQVVALVEIISPGNKSNRHAIRAFLDKAVDALSQGIHLVLVDVHPPTNRDPKGIHGLLADELGNDRYNPPADKSLTLASYAAGETVRSYVEPAAVGDRLTPMPLFLSPDEYVLIPLEETYLSAYDTVPQRWQQVLDAR